MNLFGRILIAMALLALVVPAAPAEMAEYKVDILHSAVMFRITHFGISYTYGRFNEFEGVIAFDPEDRSEGRIEMTVETASVDTNVEARDDHLRAPDYFHVEEYPEMTFVGHDWRPLEDDRYELTGVFTLLGESKEITIPVTYMGQTEGMGGEERIGFHTEFSIKRSEYGMTTDLNLVGDQVDITIAIEAIKIEPDDD